MTYAEQIHTPDIYAARIYDDARQFGLTPDHATALAKDAHAAHALHAARIARAAIEHAAELADQLRDALRDAETTAARAAAYATDTHSRTAYADLCAYLATARSHARQTEEHALSAQGHAETAAYYEAIAHKQTQRLHQTIPTYYAPQIGRTVTIPDEETSTQ